MRFERGRDIWRFEKARRWLAAEERKAPKTTETSWSVSILRCSTADSTMARSFPEYERAIAGMTDESAVTRRNKRKRGLHSRMEAISESMRQA